MRAVRVPALDGKKITKENVESAGFAWVIEWAPWVTFAAWRRGKVKVKVGDKIYTSAEQPIMVILTEQDKVNIANMVPEASSYAEFGGGLDWTREEMLAWMLEGGIEWARAWVRVVGRESTDEWSACARKGERGK
jgi:hypothetical protein